MHACIVLGGVRPRVRLTSFCVLFFVCVCLPNAVRAPPEPWHTCDKCRSTFVAVEAADLYSPLYDGDDDDRANDDVSGEPEPEVGEWWCSCKRIKYAHAAWARGLLVLAERRLARLNSSFWLSNRAWHAPRVRVSWYSDTLWKDLQDACPEDPAGAAKICGECLGSSFLEAWQGVELKGRYGESQKRLSDSVEPEPRPGCFSSERDFGLGWRYFAYGWTSGAAHGGPGERSAPDPVSLNRGFVGLKRRSDEFQCPVQCWAGMCYPEITGPERHWLAMGWHPPLLEVVSPAKDLGHWQEPADPSQCTCRSANVLFRIIERAVGHGVVDEEEAPPKWMVSSSTPRFAVGMVRRSAAVSDRCMPATEACRLDCGKSAKAFYGASLPRDGWPDAGGGPSVPFWIQDEEERRVKEHTLSNPEVEAIVRASKAAALALQKLRKDAFRGVRALCPCHARTTVCVPRSFHGWLPTIRRFRTCMKRGRFCERCMPRVGRRGL
jgi:hypothetical protein